MSIRPYRIEVPDEDLDDLRRRLAATRWPEPLPDPDWERGTEQGWLREICDYWRDGYDWRAAEARINSYEQGMAEVQGEQMHFLHVRSPHPGAVPIVITHGWCGSIVEHLDLVDRLVDPTAFGGSAGDAYHVVVPSMPGFGFSGPTRQRDFHVNRVADAVADLMAELGYDRYIAQGGDWGAVVTRRLGEAYADRLIAAHFNMLFAFPAPDEDGMEGLSDDDMAAMARAGERIAGGMGYLQIQSSKPESLTYAQTDSPAGLAGWVLEKFVAWTDHDGDVYDVLSRDQLLTNLMLYWLPNTASSSARLYYESHRAGVSAADSWTGRVEVPTGYAVYPGELVITPRAWAERRYDIVYWNTQPKGGHFAAFEQPQLFAEDLWAFKHAVT